MNREIKVGHNVIFYFPTLTHRGKIVKIWPAGVRPIGDEVVTYYHGLELSSLMGRYVWNPSIFDRIIIQKLDSVRYEVIPKIPGIQYRTGAPFEFEMKGV